jgi:hypothetical protein
MNRLPLTRSEGIVVQEFGDEILVYDLLTHKAYCLNQTASRVYRACDGKSSFKEIKRKYKFTDDVIFLALEKLKKEHLIEADNGSYVSPFAGMSRREVIRKVGFASMVALPVISSLVAPTAAMAQSGAAAGCTPGAGPGATQGLGGGCACPDPTPAGTTCGAGTTGTPGCKTGCICTATGFCNGISCLGVCG